jgi:hypothetical protein
LSLPAVFLFVLVLILLAAAAWALRGPRTSPQTLNTLDNDDSGRRHVTYFAQVRQAMADEDLTFLEARGSLEMARTVRKERREILLRYLSCLREEYFRIWRLSREVARMSPDVVAEQEFTRLRMALMFCVHYEMVRAKFRLGAAPLPDLRGLSETVSRLAQRLETAMNELGERAALASELSSSLHGGGVNTP